MESLRASRPRDCSAVIMVSAADPMNLAGIVIPGERCPALPGRHVLYRNGNLHSESGAKTGRLDALIADLLPTPIPNAQPADKRLGLF
jgi:ATP-dependent Lhr-like helicase